MLTGMERIKGLTARRHRVTIEPVIFLYMFAAYLMWPTVQGLIYWKICMKKFNVSVCANLTQRRFVQHEHYVQSVASYWFLADDLAFQVPSIIFSFFHGNVSDHIGRKTALMVPIVGQIISTTIYITNAYFFELPVSFVVVGPILSGFFGGSIGFCLTAFSYVSDDSSERSRTVRMSISQSVLNFGLASSAFVGGKLLDNTSYTFVLSTALSIFIIALAYTYFVVKCPASERYHTRHPILEVNRNLTARLQVVCTKQKFRDAFSVILKNRKFQKRTFIILIFASNLLGAIALSAGRHGVLYLYLKRHPLGWSQTLFGLYKAYKLLIDGMGLLLVLPFLKTYVGMRETGVMILTVVTCGISEGLLGICNTTASVFWVTSLGFLEACNMTCARSLLSLLVPRTEIGQIFAVLGSFQSIGGIVTGLLYNNIYPLTLDYWAGLCFVLGGFLCVAPLCILIYIHWNMATIETYFVTEDQEHEEDWSSKLIFSGQSKQ